MNKYAVSSFFRKIGLIHLMDTLKFYFEYLRQTPSRRQFKKENPSIVLPPAYFLYETYNLNYQSYYHNSIDTAQWLATYFSKYQYKKEDLYILDWGCGPGRVIRHLPNLLHHSCHFFGTDYNKRYVAWCKNNLKGISFQNNQLAPPMNYANNMFDIIYGISIFTHLSEEMHFLWFDELMRILKPGGILIITLHGEAFKIQLSDDEIKKFDQQELIIKANTKEGHRTYGAFHPTQFVHQLVGKHIVAEHTKGNVVNGKPQQDTWVIQKREE